MSKKTTTQPMAYCGNRNLCEHKGQGNVSIATTHFCVLPPGHEGAHDCRKYPGQRPQKV